MKETTGYVTNDNQFYCKKEDAENHEKRLWYEKLLNVEIPKHLIKNEQERNMLITSVSFLMMLWGKGLREFIEKYDI